MNGRELFNNRMYDRHYREVATNERVRPRTTSSSVVVVLLMIGYDPLPTHDLEDPAVDAVVPYFRDVVYFPLAPIFNDDLLCIIQNGSVGHLFDPTSPTVIVDWCVSHVSLYSLGGWVHWGL